MKKASITCGIGLLILCTAELGLGEAREQKPVTRVETATVVLKHRTLVIQATGMGRTPSAMGRAGKLVRRGAGNLNKDGLLEYSLVFNAVANYTGFKMKPVKATYKEHSVPQGVKGVRIFGEYNEVDALLPEAKPHKSLLPFGKKQHEEPSGETAGSITGSNPKP
jgi:hypothetical protein